MLAFIVLIILKKAICGNTVPLLTECRRHVRMKKSKKHGTEDGNMDIMSLQNGSDIRGIAMEGIEGQHVTLTPGIVKDLSSAFVLLLRERTGREDLRISVGMDSRLSGPALADAAKEGIVRMGSDCCMFGLCTTPAMFMSTVDSGIRCDGSIMLTASHLPWNRNGMKFFTPEGGLEKEDITALLKAAQDLPAVSSKIGKTSETDYLQSYAGMIRRAICDGVRSEDHEHPLKGFHIVVDAGNGAGGFFSDMVLSPLGANVTGSRFLHPDGRFPNHIPNPEDAAAMQSVTEAVLSNHADLGIIFDTDVDRAGAVTSDGTELNRNRLIALLAAILLDEHPGTTIVTDSITSTSLGDFIRSKGGSHHRFKRGYRNVINESKRLNSLGIDSQLAIETSGHGALKENYFLDDGAYLITKILIRMAKARMEGSDLISLLNGFQEPAEAEEIRISLPAEGFRERGNGILTALDAYAAEKGWQKEEPNYEGIRINFPPLDGDGWFLLRLSLHDPILPLNMESNSPGGIGQIARHLLPFLGKYPFLDLTALEKVAGK